MGMKLSLVDEDVVDVVRAVPDRFTPAVFASRNVKLELAKVVHLMVAIVRA
jgi:hypothetical protein